MTNRNRERRIRRKLKKKLLREQSKVCFSVKLLEMPIKLINLLIDMAPKKKVNKQLEDTNQSMKPVKAPAISKVMDPNKSKTRAKKSNEKVSTIRRI